MTELVNKVWFIAAYLSIAILIAMLLVWGLKGSRKAFLEAYRQYITAIVVITSAPLVLWILNSN